MFIFQKNKKRNKKLKVCVSCKGEFTFLVKKVCRKCYNRDKYEKQEKIFYCQKCSKEMTGFKEVPFRRTTSTNIIAGKRKVVSSFDMIKICLDCIENYEIKPL